MWFRRLCPRTSGPPAGSADGLNSGTSLSPRAEDCSSLETGRERKFSLTLPFFSIQAFNGLGAAHQHWAGPWLYWVCPFRCYCHPETPSQTLPESCWARCLGSPWPTQVDT